MDTRISKIGGQMFEIFEPKVGKLNDFTGQCEI